MELTFRTATEDDLPALVRMLADDDLGAARERVEDPLPDAYVFAFVSIAADENNEVLVAEVEGRIAAFLQLTFIPNLSHQGTWRALIEGVRVDAELRGKGVGEALMERAIERAREQGCGMVQLTTDKRRPGAARFYEKLGFKTTHSGMKLWL